jgi:hypothetical protein
MFFLYITFSFILSISGGMLLQKHVYVWGASLLTVGVICLIYTIIYYSRKNKRMEWRKKKGIDKKDHEWCMFLDCFDCVDADMLNCGHGHDCGGLDCGGFDCGT